MLWDGDCKEIYGRGVLEVTSIYTIYENPEHREPGVKRLQ
jgi:hypothetical protein